MGNTLLNCCGNAESIHKSDSEFVDQHLSIPRGPSVERQEEPCLQLEVLSSDTLEPGLTFCIDSKGLTNSAREESDGVTYFGQRLTLNGAVVNDVIIPTESKPVRGQKFSIGYNQLVPSFTLRVLAPGFGVFLKVTADTWIYDNMLAQIGNSFLVFTLQARELTIKVFSPTKSGEVQ